MAQNNLLWKVVIDFTVVACFSFILLALALWASPYQRGFFNDDMTIRLPYKLNTISEALLGCLGFALNIVTIISIEVTRDWQGKGVGEKLVFGKFLPGWVWESYVAIGVFTFGGLCQQLTATVAKYIIGRLRPHFYDVCQPLFNSSAPLNEMGFIKDFTCQNQDQSMITEARLSFPSAHSSFAMYSAIFFILYLQRKAKWRGSKLLRHAVQYLVFTLAWYVGLSRVVDHMHHWSDVAVGFGLGTAFALLVFNYVLKPKKYGLPVSWQEATQMPQPGVTVAR